MKFREILKKERNKKEVYLGHVEDKHLLVDLEKYPSIVITGETGTGKSILLDQILCELIANHTSLELGIIPIDTGGVELNYYSRTKYSLFSAINDINSSLVAIVKTLREIERRKELFASLEVSTITEYNMIADKKLPTIVLAIDDDKSLLNNPDVEKQLTSIIASLNGIGIFLILATNDIYNKFFSRDNNTYASLNISFDLTSEEEEIKANLEGASDLGIGSFMVKKDGKTEIYNTYSFDDHIITELVER